LIARNIATKLTYEFECMKKKYILFRLREMFFSNSLLGVDGKKSILNFRLFTELGIHVLAQFAFRMAEMPGICF